MSDTAGTAQSDLAEARALLGARRAAEAMMAVEAHLALRANDAAALALRAEIMAVIAATDPALAALELTAALQADRPDAQEELGHAYVALDRPADAERCFKAALALAPSSADLHAALGALYLSVEIDDGAEHHCRLALEADPGHALASQTLATLLEGRGETAAAAAVLDRAYRRQALFLQPALAPRLRVLILATVSAGNIPYRLLLPSQHYTRLVWYMEYARDAERPAPDSYDIVFNTIGDADLADPSATEVARFIAGCPRAVLNDPVNVARTRRDRTPDLLGDLEDVVIPRTVRLEAARPGQSDLLTFARQSGTEAPFLLRPIGSHGGKGLIQVTGHEPDPPQPEPGLDHYLTPYVDYRSADGLFRKYRVLFVDRRPYAYHQAISDHWLVHHETSGMTAFDARRAEEARFLADPEQALGARGLAAVTAIGRRLDLDYCGVDFGLLPDGRVLVFEANATMLAHAEDPDGPYAHKNPYIARIAAAFQEMVAARAAT